MQPVLLQVNIGAEASKGGVAPEGLTGLSIAFAGACCAALAGCVVWFWAAFRYGLDKRVLLRVMMMVGGLFVLNMTVMAFLSLLRL